MNDTIGSRIAQCRKDKGLTQEALGEKMGVSRQAVNKWEADAAIPDVDKLISLTKFFGVSVDWLLGLAVQQEPVETQDELPEPTEAPSKSQNFQSKWIVITILITALCTVTILGIILYFIWPRTATTWVTGVTEPTVSTSSLMGQDQEPELVSDVTFHLIPTEDYTKLQVLFSIVPRHHSDRDKAQIQVTLDDGTQVALAACEYDGTCWNCTLELEPANGLNYYFSSGGKSQTITQPKIRNLADQMAFTVRAQYENFSLRVGYLGLFDFSLSVYEPPILTQASSENRWETLDLVCFLNDEEIYRSDMTSYVSAEDPRGFTVIWHGISVPVPELAAGDTLKLYLQGSLTTGQALDEWLYAWKQYEDGTLMEIYSRG